MDVLKLKLIEINGYRYTYAKSDDPTTEIRVMAKNEVEALGKIYKIFGLNGQVIEIDHDESK